MIDNQPDQSDVEQLIKNAESEHWEVADWHLETGAYEQPEITLSVEYHGDDDVDVVESTPDGTKTVKDVIADIESRYEEGAPIEEVKSALYELDVDVDPDEKVENLRRKGEVYEPKQDHLRVT